MRPSAIHNILLLLSAACAPAACIMLPSPARWWCAGIAAMSFFLLLLLRRSIVKPLSAAQRGLELLRAQDLNNRLIKVGEPGADRIVSLFNDLMTRLKNERLRLKEQDTFHRLLIEASPMGIILLNLDGRVSMTNGAFIRIAEIRNEDGIVGKRPDEQDSPIVRTLLAIPRGESRVIRQDGSRLYRGYHLQFLQEGFHRHFYLVETLTDELRTAEKEAYEKVIRMISHEVNNTMGSVLTVLETLAEDTAGDPDLNETIESCRDVRFHRFFRGACQNTGSCSQTSRHECGNHRNAAISAPYGNRQLRDYLQQRKPPSPGNRERADVCQCRYAPFAAGYCQYREKRSGEHLRKWKPRRCDSYRHGK